MRNRVSKQTLTSVINDEGIISRKNPQFFAIRVLLFIVSTNVYIFIEFSRWKASAGYYVMDDKIHLLRANVSFRPFRWIHRLKQQILFYMQISFPHKYYVRSLTFSIKYWHKKKVGVCITGLMFKCKDRIAFIYLSWCFLLVPHCAFT